MNRTSLYRIIKNAVPIPDLHLHHVPGYPPIASRSFLATQPENLDHPFLIALIQADGCFPMAAKTATGAGKNISHLIELFRIFAHDKKNRRPVEDRRMH
jgi:hypothetical protein